MNILILIANSDNILLLHIYFSYFPQVVKYRSDSLNKINNSEFIFPVFIFFRCN
ncbi:hypothetical protein Q7O_001676 [Pectobacterium carotovorum subsp. carotovorum PCCS1]|nr:hypothetical protein [Pectobacterium carotovorum subsp. carotovorum PCCS1]